MLHFVWELAAGLGLIQAPTPGIQSQLTQGELIEVLPHCPPPAMPLFIMFPAGRFLAPRVRVLIDWLIELFSDYPQLSPTQPSGR